MFARVRGAELGTRTLQYFAIGSLLCQRVRKVAHVPFKNDFRELARP